MYISVPEMKHPENEESFKIKARICMGIIKSEWMKVKRELDVVNMHAQNIYDELQRDYPNIHAEYISSKDASLVNPYRIQNITTRNDESLDEDTSEMETDEVQEYVFSCLARNRKSGKLEEYFISQEYDLKECAKKVKNIVPTVIRFIFTGNGRGETIPVAFTDDRLPL